MLIADPEFRPASGSIEWSVTVRLACSVFAAILGGALTLAQDTTRAETAFQKFWEARSPAEAAGAVDDIAASGVTFNEAWQRLKHGRSYGPQDSGVIRLNNRFNGIDHYLAVTVPAGHNPGRRRKSSPPVSWRILASE